MKAIRKLWQSRRGAIGVFTAAMLPVMLGMAALTVDAGLWTVSETRLQYAADAAAVNAGYLLTNASIKSQSTSATLSTFQSVALAGVQDATGMRLIGKLQTPVGVSVASDYSSVTVTLTSQAAAYFAGAVGFTPSVMTATAKAALPQTPPCVLALATAAPAINVDNMGSIKARNCGIYSNSSASNSIYLDSGTISGATLGAHGGVQKSNSGSNTLSPATPATYGATLADPYAAKTAPTPGACNYNNKSYSTYNTWNVSPGVYCGDTTFGGNGSTINFAPGIYYIVGGKLTFNNATIGQSAGVTFLIVPSSTSHNVDWTNYSNTSINFTSPATGPTAGIVFWQTCLSSGALITNTFAGGSTLALSGAMYAPCGALDISNNAQIAAPANGSMSVVANTIYAHGSGGIQAASTTPAISSSTAVLTQ